MNPKRVVVLRVAWISRALVLLLALPAALHVATWFQWYVSLPTLLVGFLAFRRRWRTSTDAETLAIPGVPLALMAVIVGAWIATSGIIGHVHQTGDYVKHGAIMDALMTRPWPVVFQEERGPGVLIYYVGYYLPAALAGRLLGFGATQVVQGLIAWIGILGALLLLLRRMGPRGWWAALLLLFFASGADILGFLSVHGRFPGLAEGSDYWAKFAIHHGLTALLHWAPQHAITALVATALFLDDRSVDSAEGIALPFAATLSWSPFMTLGLLPLAGAALLRLRSVEVRVRTLWLALVLGAPLAAMYRNKVPDVHGWIWEHREFSAGVALLFLPLKILWPAVIVLFVWPWMDRAERTLAVISFGWVAGIALFYYGWYNDLGMRSSMPSLITLAVVGWTAWRRTSATWRKAAFVLMAAVGIVPSVTQVARAVMNPVWTPSSHSITDIGLTDQYVAPLKGRPLLKTLRIPESER